MPSPYGTPASDVNTEHVTLVQKNYGKCFSGLSLFLSHSPSLQ